MLSIEDPDFETKIELMRAESARRDTFEPRITNVWLHESDCEIVIQLNNNICITIPWRYLQNVCEYSYEQLAGVQVGPAGCSIIWEPEGEGFELSSLLAGRFGSRKWMTELAATTGIPTGYDPIN